MDTQTWFDALLAALEDDVDATTPASVTDDERDALLDLARVAAHTSERWTAPVSTFFAGVAYAAMPATQRAVKLRELVDHLDPDAT